MAPQLPLRVCYVVGEILAECNSHTTLDALMVDAGAPGDPPGGNKQQKATAWLRRASDDPSTDASKVLGRALAEFMEVRVKRWPEDPAIQAAHLRIVDALTEAGLRYQEGGRVVRAGVAPVTMTLAQQIQARDWNTVHAEFDRALENLDRDPPAAITAACAILEALCKVYIDTQGLETPTKQTLMPLWSVVQKDLGLDPGSKEDDDVRQILGGMGGAVNGIASLRTHAGSAHGRGTKVYRVLPRHARLAVGAAHTLASFIIDTWDARGQEAKAKSTAP